jgi:hypothetical protein
MPNTKTERHVTANCLYIALAIVGTLVIPLAAAAPASNVVAAVFPPWWNAADVFKAAASAGEPLRVGQFSSIVVVRGDRLALAARLRSAGALILIDSRVFAGCETFAGAAS